MTRYLINFSITFHYFDDRRDYVASSQSEIEGNSAEDAANKFSDYFENTLETDLVDGPSDPDYDEACLGINEIEALADDN